MNIVIDKLALRYGGTVAQPEECVMYLNEDQHFLFGLKLDDPAANFHLMTEHDLHNLSETTRTVCLQTCTAPFRGMKLIVYKDETQTTNFKLINGMASRLVAEMIVLCNDKQLWASLEWE